MTILDIEQKLASIDKWRDDRDKARLQKDALYKELLEAIRDGKADGLIWHMATEALKAEDLLK